MTNAVANANDKPKDVALVDEDKLGLRGLLNQKTTKDRFNEVMGKNGAVFASSILSVFNGSETLQRCTPKSILNAGFQAAACHLSINPTLGHAAIVPYKNRKKDAQGNWNDAWEAQFQIMWKGIVQLALRTAQYKRINLVPVFEGQLIEHDTFKGTVKLDAKGRKSDKVIGIYFYFSLVSGLEREEYWPIIKCLRHGYRFSQAFSRYASGKWVDDENIKVITKDKKDWVDPATLPEWLHEDSGSYSMCAKTVVKMTLQKWGILSTEMQNALQVDQAVIDDKGARFVDNPEEGTRTPDEAEESRQRPQRASAKKDDKKDAAAAAKPADEVKEVVVKFESTATTELDGKAVKVAKTDDGIKFYLDPENKAAIDFINEAAKQGHKVKVSYSGTKDKQWVELVAKA